MSWIGQSLDAACRRLDGQILSAIYVPDEGRLSCIVMAASQEDVRRLLEIALLPSARIHEVVEVLGGPGDLRHPAGDLDSGVDSEVIEDVGHVRLDSPLREE
jgi:hypothetical protein